MSPDADSTRRLWRARRRHDAIDAILSPVGTRYDLTFVRNGRVLVTWSFDLADEAVSEADAKLRSLQRVGWVDHW